MTKNKKPKTINYEVYREIRDGKRTGAYAHFCWYTDKDRTPILTHLENEKINPDYVRLRKYHLLADKFLDENPKVEHIKLEIAR